MNASPPIVLERPYAGIQLNIAWVFTFVALAVLILDPLFGSLAALVFLAAGLALIAIRPGHSLNAALSHWYILCLPLYCIVSTVWSQFPSVTLRHAIQLAVTIVIAIVIAHRVPPVVLQRFLFGIYGIGTIGSLAFGRVRDDIGAWVGIFGSKNAFAAVISAFILASLTVLLDRNAPHLMRLAAFGGLVVSAPLLLLAQSTGAIVVLVPAVGTALLIHFSRRIGKPQRILAGLLIGMAGTIGLILFMAHGEAFLARFLDYSGKDDTLTGRTELWEFGRYLISQNPLFGVGYQAFWVQGYAPAEALWADFGIEARRGFNFHNTYISNGVEIGMLGLALQVAVLYGALLGSLLWAFRYPSATSAFFCSFMVMVVGASFMEVAVFFQFSVTTILVICTLVYSLQANAARRAHAAHPAGGALR